MRTGTLTWLRCMWRARRIYNKPGVLFSARVLFLEELRPFVSPRQQDRIAYPDAIFWITPADVDRATRAFEERFWSENR